MSTAVARSGAVATAVTAVVLAAGCGSSSPPAATSTAPAATSTTPTAVPGSGTATSGSPSLTSVSPAGFCTALGDYGRKFKTALGGGQLATVKAQLPPVVAEGTVVKTWYQDNCHGVFGQ